MEDDHTIEGDYAAIEGHSFVAVYDGHGGAEAAKYAGQNMLKHISETTSFKAYVEDKGRDTEVRRKACRGIKEDWYEFGILRN